MKKFFFTTGLISLAGSLVLFYKFNYSPQVLSYHLLLILLLHALVLVLNIACCFIPQIRVQKLLANTVNFIFIYLLVFFYLSISVSNAFWGKAVTADILINYISSLGELISILPVESWIFYTVIVLVFVSIFLIFWFSRPQPAQLRKKYQELIQNRGRQKKLLFITTAALALLFIFQQPLLRAKRIIHFSGEPLMEFALGQMWDSHSMEYVYDKDRIKNTLKDKACIDSVAKENSNNPDRIVMVILLDALRKDFLPMYGYERNTTPFLDSLFRSGHLLRVKDPFSTSTTTLLGVAGLFGSKDWKNFSYAGLNLMKFLKRKEFTTYAFLTGQHRSWYGLASIYRNDCDYFYESTTSPAKQDYDDLTTLRKFRDVKIKPNSFIYFHLLSTHNIGRKNPQFKKFMPDKIGISTDRRSALVNNYDNGILQADFVISQLFEKLKRDGLLNKTSIYIVADHGELFGEEGQWSHSGSIQQDVLSIPLLIYDQDLSWYKNLEAATIKDIAPTIAHRLNYVVPSCWEGVSLGNAVHDFSMQVASGVASEFPTGILSRKDSIIRLDLMNENNEVKKTIIKERNSGEWKTVSNN